MTCPTCGGTTERGSTNLPVELESGILYIKQVPADICKQCGETFIPDEVADRIEKMVDRAKAEKVEIEVITYEGAA